MVITPKPDKKDISKFIGKGMDSSEKESKEDWCIVSLRITNQLLEAIQDQRNHRIGISRNAWILEAIQEKIKKDSNA